MDEHVTSIVQSGFKELDESLGGGFFRPANLMITGAPFCGKKLLSLEILSNGLKMNEGAIFVSTSHTAEEVRSEWENYGLKPSWEEEGRVKFVDCYSKMLGIRCDDTHSIRRVPSVLDFTKLSVTIYELCSNFLLKKISTRLVMDSLSSLLTYSSPQVVMRFLHIFMGKLRRLNVLSFFLLEEGTHDETTFNLLKTYSNGVIQMDQDQQKIFIIGFVRGGGASLSYEITEEGVVLRNKRDTEGDQDDQ